MRETLQRIMELQPEWSSAKTPAMDERGRLIRRSGPAWLGQIREDLAGAIAIPTEDLIIEGRDGTGPKTEVPWFRFGSRSRSPSATIGWYCVYLFDTEGRTTFLTVGRGSTEWTGVDFKPRDHDELRGQAEWARTVLTGLTQELQSEIQLRSRRSPLGPSYEAGTVVAIEYQSGAVPDPDELQADALRMAELLGRIYRAEETDPTAPGPPPEVKAVIAAAAEAAGKPTGPRGPGFQPNAEQRRAIEMRGMEVVAAALVDWGWTQITDSSANKPYDYHCLDGDEELYVEVKATTGDGSSVVLTRNEVDHARVNYPRTALAVVSRITPPSINGDTAKGGELRFVVPWEIDESRLSVVSYVYQSPGDEGELWA